MFATRLRIFGETLKDLTVWPIIVSLQNPTSSVEPKPTNTKLTSHPLRLPTRVLTLFLQLTLLPALVSLPENGV